MNTKRQPVLFYAGLLGPCLLLNFFPSMSQAADVTHLLVLSGTVTTAQFTDLPNPGISVGDTFIANAYFGPWIFIPILRDYSAQAYEARVVFEHGPQITSPGSPDAYVLSASGVNIQWVGSNAQLSPSDPAYDVFDHMSFYMAVDPFGLGFMTAGAADSLGRGVNVEGRITWWSLEYNVPDDMSTGRAAVFTLISLVGVWTFLRRKQMISGW